MPTPTSHRRKNRILAHRALVAVALSLLANGAPARAATIATNVATCPVDVVAFALDGRSTDAVFALWSRAQGKTVSGVITAYAGGSRFQIPFAGVTAADPGNSKTAPSPIVVRFAQPTDVESASVSSIDGIDCAIHDPYISPKLLPRGGKVYDARYAGPPSEALYRGWSRTWPSFIAQAVAAVPLAAPEGQQTGTPECEIGYANAYVTHAQQARLPDTYSFPFNGTVILRVTIAASGTHAGTQIVKSSHDQTFDNSALTSSAESTFVPSVYRCQPVAADYFFVVDFMQQ
jgi:TonB family protein